MKEMRLKRKIKDLGDSKVGSKMVDSSNSGRYYISNKMIQPGSMRRNNQ